MIKASGASTPAGATIAVAVVSFGNDPQPITLPVGATVAQALTSAGVERGASEVFVSGETASDGDILEEGDVVSVVSSKQAGA